MFTLQEIRLADLYDIDLTSTLSNTSEKLKSYINQIIERKQNILIKKNLFYWK